MRANAPNRAALRMLLYARRWVKPQLCCLLLTLAVIAIPLNGIPAPRMSSLVPLRTILLPFDTSIQAPDQTVVQFTAGAPSGTRIDLAWNAISFPGTHDRDFACCRVPDGRGHPGAVVLPTGRSPPLA